uniref:Variant surface glycoprotein 605 n=1 Tax=Trypanosoma brucei TaxID=5691 RepID=M4SXG7_9TRYP|nr:variant surface glycoprotein 605 [Trypanosoma brucei]
MRRSLCHGPSLGAIALIFLCSAATPTAIHEVGKQLNHGCHSEAHLEASSAALQQALKDNANQLAEGRKLQLQLLLAAAISKSSGGGKYLPPLAAVNAKIAQAAAARASGQETLNTALDALWQLKGMQAMVYAVSKLEIKQIGSTQATGTNPPAEGHRIQYSQVGGDEDICEEPAAKRRDPDPAQQADQNKQTLKIHALEDAAGLTKTTAAFLCGKSSTIGARCGDSAAGQMTWYMLTDGPITTSKLVKYHRKSDNTDDYTAAAPKTSGQLPPQKYVAARLKAVKNAELELPKLKFDAADLKKFALSETPDFRQAAAASVDMTLTAEQLSNPPQKLVNLIKTTYGADQATYNAKIWNTLADIPISKEAAGTETATTLKELTTEEQLGRAAAYYLAKAAAKDAQPNTNCGTNSDEKQQENSKTDKCKEDTEKDKCNEKDGCKYNEKNNNCEEDPAKTTAAASTTNTTGSNSFVINKAPLLLAVLLF